MTDPRHGLRSIADIAMNQQRACEVCGKPFKKANLPMLKDAMVADCDCLKDVARADDKTRRIEQEMEQANIPARLTRLKFETYPGMRQTVDQVEAYLHRHNPGLLLLIGAVGRGKSGLACAALERLAEKGSVRYFYAFDLLNDRVTRDTMLVMREALQPLSIVIDEIGLQLKTDAAKEFMERLLIGRHDDLKNTILISNLGAAEFKPLIGTRAFDRATNDGRVIIFEGETFRGKNVDAKN